ncbi:hypothetical protein V8C26DRAFT_355451 [Trichoderma gracile]
MVLSVPVPSSLLPLLSFLFEVFPSIATVMGRHADQILGTSNQLLYLARARDRGVFCLLVRPCSPLHVSLKFLVRLSCLHGLTMVAPWRKSVVVLYEYYEASLTGRLKNVALGGHSQQPGMLDLDPTCRPW